MSIYLVPDVASIYVLNTQTLSASTVISSILLYCNYYYFCLCLFANDLVVCVRRHLCEARK